MNEHVQFLRHEAGYARANDTPDLAEAIDAAADFIESIPKSFITDIRYLMVDDGTADGSEVEMYELQKKVYIPATGESRWVTVDPEE